MGFMDEYNKALEEEKKKKKKTTSSNASSRTSTTNKTSSFMDTYRSNLSGMNRVDNDIAPITPTVVTRSTKKDERKWFEKGAFEDGYQIGDLTKTILGSATDALENLGSGIIGMGESALDAFAYLGNATAKGQYYQNGGGYNLKQDKLFEEQHKKATKATEQFIKKDLYDEEAVAKAIISNPMKALTGIDAEEDSVFGERTDSLVQSGGQLLATAGLQAVGVPWFMTTGATSFGSEAENALNQGATFEEAGMSATISAGAEVLTEKLSGGIKFGGKALDDSLSSVIASNISNKLTQKLAKFGLDVVGEGAEEVVSQFASNLGSALYKEEDLSEILFSEEAFDGYLESFIGGAVLGGFGNVVQNVKSNKNGVDSVTELKTNEQAVVDKVYNDRLAEVEKNGKLSAKEKTKLYDQVMNDLDKGYISTDDIESVLAGEKYQPYKEILDEESSIREELKGYQTEYENLSKKDTLTLEETARKNELVNLYTETKAKLDDKDRAGKRDYLKATLDKEVYEMSKGSHLVESFHENVRANQKFEADVSKYEGKGKALIQSVIDSEAVDNTRKMHEFMDTLAHIADDSGRDITVAKQDKLLDILEQQAKDEGRTFDRSAFDGKIIDGVRTKNGIILNPESKRAFNFIAGHEITHNLEKSGHYAELYKALVSYGAEEYQKRFNERAKQYKGIYADENYRDEINMEVAADMVGDYLFADFDFVSHLSTKHQNVFQKVWSEIKHLYKLATAGSQAARELERAKHLFEKAYREAGKAQTDTKDGGTKYSLLDIKEKYKDKTDYLFLHEKRDGTISIDNMVVKQDYRNQGIGTQILNDVISYADENGKTIVLTPTTEFGTKAKLTKWYKANGFVENKGRNADYRLSDTMYRLPRPTGNGVKYSLSSEQQEFFKDSVVRDENGNLKVMYHGTSRGGFNVFDTYGSNYGLFGTGSYFTDSKTIGESYTKKGKGKNPQVYEAYLNIKNPMDMDAAANPAEWAKAFPDADFPESGTNEQFYRAVEEFYADQWMSKWEVAEEIQAGIESNMGYDGITHIGGGRVNPNGERHQVYIAFQPEQIKNIDNAKPTDNPDIRYSLSDSNGKKLSAAQSEYFKDSKVRDENGSLMVMYHGTPNGDFTVFKDGTYFTPSKEYADRYQNPGASSISTGKVASNPKTFEVYLDIKKPFDIADAEARSIYINDYIKGGNAMGINPYMSDAEYAKINAIDWTEGEDLRDFLIENEYDYDGLVLDEGGTGGYGDEVQSRGKSYVVFSPEQVKNIDNQNPTSDPDIRFSLSEAVEETKDLLAVHNLRGSELIKSLELGGLPMPSIAILKANAVHDEYGEVSLILRKDAIDPEANGDNKVYGGDAWTPTYPRIEYKPRKSVEDRISDKYYDLARRIGYDEVRPLYSYVTDMERQLNNNRGEAAILEYLYEDTDMMQVYLQDVGKGKIQPVEKETVTKISEVEAEMNQFLLDALGKDMIAGFATPAGENPRTHRMAFIEDHRAEIETAYKRLCMEVYNFTEEQADNVVGNSGDRHLMKILRDVLLYSKNNGITVKTETDYAATRKKILEAASDGYKEWVDSLFKGVEEKSGIRNNVDYWTRSGNRRSWDALHWENTLENVVKTMKADRETGGGSMSPFTDLFGESHKKYGSIAEIKADSDRLGKIDQEEYEKIKDSFSKRFAAIANSIKDPGERNPFIAADTAAEQITEAVRNRKTKSGILTYLRKYNSRATMQTVDDVLALVSDIANMPTGYFEAKPRRAVGFEEVGVFVIPNDADVKLKQELLNRGYSIAEYDPNVEGDRQRVVNQFEELKFSLSDIGEEHKSYGNWNVYNRYANPATELRLDIAPVTEDSSVVAENATTTPTVSKTETIEFPDDLAPAQEELERLEAERNQIYSGLESAIATGSANEVGQLAAEYDSLTARIRELENAESERTDSLTDEDAPPDTEAPLSMKTENFNPYKGVTLDDISRSHRTYSDRNPGARKYIEEGALGFLYDVNNSTHGERWYNDELYYATGGEQGFGGTSRHTTGDIADLKDTYGYTWEQLRKAAEDVAKGEVRSVAAKRIEYLIHNRLMEGYTDIDGRRYEPNREYITFLNESFANENRAGSFDNLLENADKYAPQDIAPVKPLTEATPDTQAAPIYESKDKNAVKGQTTMFEPPKPNPKVATVLTEESAIAKEKSGIGSKLVSALVDKGMVFENLSLKTGNHELQSKYNYALPSNTEARAQYLMEHGANGVMSLKDIKTKVEKTGMEKAFFDYMYHVHNIDRMTLEDRFTDTPNKPVFGETVTADVSRKKVAQYEKNNPSFKAMAQDIYRYNAHLRKMLVDNGVISRETADLWQKMYPHYVPIRRVDSTGQNISVPLDTNKTGVNAPIKRATGGSSDITPLFNTMAQRTEQTYRAIARNAFGIELKNTLGTTINAQENTTDVDETIDTIVQQEEKLLKPGTMNSEPTFTVFENGERVEFEITEDMYDALKPAGKILGYRNQAVKAVGDARRNLLTVWNPVFALYRNPIKDIQDVAINSQHAAKTYLNVPNAIYQMATGGEYATEYHKNGGKSNTYFDGRTNKFKAEDNAFKKIFGMPVRAIENAGEFIEEIPRLAEYIASRQEGRSVERSMLDASRVTTNFAAGGDFTKFLNSHGFTFLNASVQGVSQHVRNFREAKQQGLKGYVKVLAKYAVAGLPGILLNNLLWDDDEEYEELSDYVKQNYYVVAKTQDGKFVRIPKGRTAAVMGELMNQMENLVTGDDEADFSTFFELFMNNIAPNNPIENNVLAPIGQVLKNEAWYGGELVPSRLQNLPAEEQYDESTDSISKWLGEKTGTSPYKWNYLIDQYSGGLGDVFLPMLTPEAESGDNSLLGNFLAPWKKEVTTDSVLNNKYPGDFYDLRDELEVIANGRNATEEDAMRSMYMDSVSWDMSDLYKQKREIQNSDMPDAEKYEAVREIQEQINALAESAMNGYNNVSISGLYAEVGDRRFNMDAESGKWYEIQEKNADGSDNYCYQMEQEVTQALGISYEEYWNNREEYNYAYDKPEQYALSQVVGGYQDYRGYLSELWDISADKDENGKSINGSRKEKVIDYLNNLDADYYTKIILFKNEYNADDTYNHEIIDYLNSRDDISYEQMETILKYLGFEVDAKGNISWD